MDHLVVDLMHDVHALEARLVGEERNLVAQDFSFPALDQERRKAGKVAEEGRGAANMTEG